jgi:hypothetical protein
MAGHVSLREYARQRAAAGRPGRSHVAVHKAIATGRLAKAVVRDGNGKVVGVRPEVADQEWESATDMSQQRETPAGGRPPAQQTFFEAQRAPDPPAPGGQTSGVAFARARAVREGFLARLAEIEYRERSGQIVEADDVAREAERFGREVRDEILNYLGRVGPQLAPMRDPRALTDKLVAGAAEVLARLAIAEGPPP